MADLSQDEAWLDADELERLAGVVDGVTSFNDSNRIIAPRVYMCVDDIENTSEEGTVWMMLTPDPEGDTPYYALLYDAPTSDPRTAFMLGSDDLRELSAQLRAFDEAERTEGIVVILDSVDDGTRDSDIHPHVEVQKKSNIMGRAAAHLWFDHVERFP